MLTIIMFTMTVFGSVVSFTKFVSTIVPTKSDSDVIFCFQLLRKH